MASTYYRLHVHVVFATHERVPTLDVKWRNDLHAYIGGTLRGLDTTPLAIGGVGRVGGTHITGERGATDSQLLLKGTDSK